MAKQPSFTHLLNPFPAREGSEHAIASDITWRTVAAASAKARETGVDVRVRAVILPGDEAAVMPPTMSTVYLDRTVQDIADLKPRRPLPLIGDILRVGAVDVSTTHIIFSNMDISVQLHFYTKLHEIVSGLGLDIPFTIGRINIDPSLATAPLDRLYTANGALGVGYDCFIMPRQIVDGLDLGVCCIGAPHFDLLLLMALDLQCGHRAASLNDTGLTFHLGNDITWAAMIDYVEHNLAESLGAIERMKNHRNIRPDSFFDRLDKRHFQRNATLTSTIFRKIRRIPLLSSAILHAKRAIGRQY